MLTNPFNASPMPGTQRRKPETVNRLTNAQQFKFFCWFSQTDLTHEDTDSTIATRATTALGFKITQGNVHSAWEGTGRARPQAPKTDAQQLAILRRAVENLYHQVGSPLPVEWDSLPTV